MISAPAAPAAPAAPSTQRKRQRLDQLVDRIALLVATPPPAPHASSATSPDVPDALLMSRLRQASSSVFSFEHVVLNHNHNHHHHNNNNNNNNSRSNKNNNCSPCQEHSDASDAEEDSVFSVDSPSAISFSPLSFDDDFRHHFRMPLVDASTPLNLSKTSRRCPYSSGSSSSSSSSSSNGNGGGGGGGGDSCNRRRRARSDSDLRNRLEQLRPPPLMGRSVKRNSSDSTDDSWSPLDLSVRSSSSQTPSSSCASSCTSSCTSTDFLETPSRAAASKLLTRSISLSQYLSAEYPCGDVSADDGAAKTAAAPLIRNTTAAFSCEQCGQGFDVHDRLVKHLASRHKTQQQRNGASAGEVVKGYQCDVCQRPFARSDMLTRHMRLHTGLKPYTCRICGQVFSRSDHLSTHQRTHTGEKPYRCPQCAYAACRRDMITRHLRTHARSEDLTDAADPPRKDST